MEIAELRTGNYVMCRKSNDAGIYSVLCLNGYNLLVMLDGARFQEWHALKFIRPIKLTDEMIERLGFTRDTAVDGSPVMQRGQIQITKPKPKEPRFYVWYAITKNDDYYQQIKTVATVHELQNLVYDLTKERLWMLTPAELKGKGQ